MNSHFKQMGKKKKKTESQIYKSNPTSIHGNPKGKQVIQD